jgi:hypothetical protein
MRNNTIGTASMLKKQQTLQNGEDLFTIKENSRDLNFTDSHTQ